MSAPGSGQREGRDRRRLAAIVSVDVVGYSRLMGRDESGTLAALKAHRRELIDPKIAEHHGRIVKTTGDGLLLEYSSVVDAVRCSGDIQRGIAAWSLPSLLRTAPAPAQPPLSVAVLPFTAPGGAAADEQFADALTQDVTTALAQWRWATVASGRKVTSQKGKDSDARSVGRDLNVRYLVEAELRRAGNKLAITVRLIDAESATNAWSERLEFDAVRPLDEPSAPATRISRRLQQSIYEAEMQRAAARPVPGSAWDLVLRGDVALSAGDDPLTNAVAARKWYDEALRIDPRFVPALVSVAVADNELLSNDLDLDRARFAQAVEEMDKLTARAVSVDVNDSAAWFVRAAALTWLNRWDEALAANEKGQALDPSNAIFVSNQAYITLVVAGPDQALVLAKRASAMDRGTMSEEGFSIRMTCHINLLLGRYGDAVRACEAAAARGNWWADHAVLVAVYAQQGDLAKASLAKAELLKQQPRFTIDKFKASEPASRVPRYLQLAEVHLYTGLRKAGLADK